MNTNNKKLNQLKVSVVLAYTLLLCVASTSAQPIVNTEVGDTQLEDCASVQKSAEKVGCIQIPEASKAVEPPVKITTDQQKVQFVFGDIAAKNLSCEIYNNTGQKVYNLNIDAPTNRMYPFEAADLNAGNYTVNFFNTKSDIAFSTQFVKSC